MRRSLKTRLRRNFACRRIQSPYPPRTPLPDEDTFHAHDRLFRAGLSNPAAAAFLIMRSGHDEVISVVASFVVAVRGGAL